MKKPILKSFCVNALMFLFVAIPGFILSLGAAIEFCSTMEKKGAQVMTQILCLFVWIISSFMMLLGVGKWGSWRYLYIFIIIPLAICSIVLLAPPGGKLMPAGIAGVIFFAVFNLVRRSYENTIEKQ